MFKPLPCIADRERAEPEENTMEADLPRHLHNNDCLRSLCTQADGGSDRAVCAWC